MPAFALADADIDVPDNEEFWIAPNAILIGRIILKKNASIWWGAILRGDNEPIEVGENSNVQDGSILHTDMGAPLTIGANVTIGHRAMLHGCVVEDYCLIGIGATLLNHARIETQCLVGAHALITERKSFPAGSLITGAPAQAVRETSETQRQVIAGSALHYVENWKRYRRDLKPSSIVV